MTILKLKEAFFYCYDGIDSVGFLLVSFLIQIRRGKTVIYWQPNPKIKRENKWVSNSVSIACVLQRRATLICHNSCDVPHVLADGCRNNINKLYVTQSVLSLLPKCNSLYVTFLFFNKDDISEQKWRQRDYFSLFCLVSTLCPCSMTLFLSSTAKYSFPLRLGDPILGDLYYSISPIEMIGYENFVSN